MTKKQPDWGSAKGTRRAHIAKSYRIVLNVGDNFGDFVDESRGTEAERLKVMDEHKDRWGREWIMIANPTYGSFETAPFNHDFKLSRGTGARPSAACWRPGRAPEMGGRWTLGRDGGPGRDTPGPASHATRGGGYAIATEFPGEPVAPFSISGLNDHANS